MISAVVLTKNNEAKIGKLISNLSFCEEILVIDSFSQDKTVRIARKKGAKVFKRNLNNNFANQRNFALKKARGEWILFIDIDEKISLKLKKEILTQIKKEARRTEDQKTSGFFLKRQDFFLGRWLKYGETAGVKLLRLAKKDAGQWQGQVHEVWQVKGKTKILKNPLQHIREIDVRDFIQRINFYSSLRAKELKAQGKNIRVWEMFLFPVAKFLQNYVLKLGFLDGVQGLIMAVGMSLHSFLVRTKAFLKSC